MFTFLKTSIAVRNSLLTVITSFLCILKRMSEITPPIWVNSDTFQKKKLCLYGEKKQFVFPPGRRRRM